VIGVVGTDRRWYDLEKIFPSRPRQGCRNGSHLKHDSS
jgi:hypothetical protein